MPKSIVITNNTKSSLRFVFCTESMCRCDICYGWIQREVKPMSGTKKGRVTYGVLVVNAMKTLTARVCPNWDCVGEVYFDGVPDKIKHDMLFDFDESEGYRLNGNKATLMFVETTKRKKDSDSSSSSDSSESSSDDDSDEEDDEPDEEDDDIDDDVDGDAGDQSQAADGGYDFGFDFGCDYGGY